MNGVLDRLREVIASDDLGTLVYGRFSERHSEVDLGLGVTRLLGLAHEFFGPVDRVHARGQWIGEHGALTLTLDHTNGAICLIDLSAVVVEPLFAERAMSIRIEGNRATVELLPGSIVRLSGEGWRREETIGPLVWPTTGEDPAIQDLLARAMRSAETGEAA